MITKKTHLSGESLEVQCTTLPMSVEGNHPGQETKVQIHSLLCLIAIICLYHHHHSRECFSAICCIVTQIFNKNYKIRDVKPKSEKRRSNLSESERGKEGLQWVVKSKNAEMLHYSEFCSRGISFATIASQNLKYSTALKENFRITLEYSDFKLKA